jgi:hypothetical protein
MAPDGQPLGLAPRPRYACSMSGRARLSSDVSEIELVFSIPPHRTSRLAGTWRRPTRSWWLRERTNAMMRGTTLGRRREVIE